jgi:hypothetical protein
VPLKSGHGAAHVFKINEACPMRACPSKEDDRPIDWDVAAVWAVIIIALSMWGAMLYVGAHFVIKYW